MDPPRWPNNVKRASESRARPAERCPDALGDARVQPNATVVTFARGRHPSVPRAAEPSGKPPFRRSNLKNEFFDASREMNQGSGRP